MSEWIKPLSALRPGQTGVVQSLITSPEVSLKLIEMGVGPGERITFLRQAPLGGPIEIDLMGFRMALRPSEADQIILKGQTET